jgi:hypothetical protein
MEKVYPRVPKTDVAQVFLREAPLTGPSGTLSPRTGKGRGEGAAAFAGRVIYFPWDIDRTFWEVLSVDHFKLLRNAVEWATNEPPIVAVTRVGVLDATVWRQKNSMTVHLVNLANPMMMKGPVRELIPIGPQKVRVRVPAGGKPRRVHLLASDKAPRFDRFGNYLSLTVPSILDHEIVAIDL